MNAHEGPDAKRQKQFFQLSSEDLVQLFPLESSEVLVRCGERQAGGAEGSSVLTLLAGERFEVVVTIKSRFGPIRGTGQHVEQMMRLIEIVLSRDDLIRDDDPHLSMETGVVIFPLKIQKAGNFEISANIKHDAEFHHQPGPGYHNTRFQWHEQPHRVVTQGGQDPTYP